MARKKIAGPGRIGSTAAMKKSLKKSGSSVTKNIPAEDSLTVRFLDEPEDFHGYYEHWMGDHPEPCVEGQCDGCDSDDPEVQRRSFKYLANAYVVDDQKVWALKLPKSLVEHLMTFHTKYKGTLLDRDYELSRTGSGKEGTKYFAAPEDRAKMNLARFEKKKHDLGEVLASMVSDDDDDDDDVEDEPVRKKKSSTRSASPKKSRDTPWDDDDDDEDEEPVRRVKKKTSTTVKKSSVKRPVKTTVRRKK